jgi:hypothetical protein
MKLIYCLLITVSLCYCDSANSQIENKLVIETHLKGVYGSYGQYLIGLRVRNISNKNVELFTMNCATALNIILDSSDFEVLVNDCPSNQISQVTLCPKQEFHFQFLIKRVNFLTSTKKLKIGWIILTKENTPDVDDLIANREKFRKNLENIIWAKPIEINGFVFDTIDII